MKTLLILILAALCEPALAEPRLPFPGQALVDPLRVQGGRFYDLRPVVTNYLAWTAAMKVPPYPAGSTMERERLRNLELLDPSTHAWGQFLVSGRVKEHRPEGIVLENGGGYNGYGRMNPIGFFLLKNSPIKTGAGGSVTALAIPINRSGEMAVYDYGTPVRTNQVVSKTVAEKPTVDATSLK